MLPGGISARRPTSTKVRSLRSIGASQRFHKRRTVAGLAGSCVNDNPEMDSTTREPLPICAYGWPLGNAPASMWTSFADMRRRYDTYPVGGTPSGPLSSCRRPVRSHARCERAPAKRPVVGNDAGSAGVETVHEALPGRGGVSAHLGARRV